jgi:hypothetical protein
MDPNYSHDDPTFWQLVICLAIWTGLIFGAEWIFKIILMILGGGPLS